MSSSLRYQIKSSTLVIFHFKQDATVGTAVSLREICEHPPFSHTVINDSDISGEESSQGNDQSKLTWSIGTFH